MFLPVNSTTYTSLVVVDNRTMSGVLKPQCLEGKHKIVFPSLHLFYNPKQSAGYLYILILFYVLEFGLLVKTM